MDTQEVLYFIVRWLLVFFGLFIVGRSLLAVRRERSSEKWPTTLGVIQSANIAQNVASSLDYYVPPIWFYKIRVAYTYTVDGIEYLSDKLSLTGENHLSKELARSRIKGYKSGQLVKVYYDPDNPSISVIEPGGRRRRIYGFSHWDWCNPRGDDSSQNIGHLQDAKRMLSVMMKLAVAFREHKFTKASNNHRACAS